MINMHIRAILHCVFLPDLISLVPFWIKLTPGLKTPERDSRVKEALMTTQRRDSLYLRPQSFRCHSPASPDPHQTGGSPSMPPGRSLRGQGQQKVNDEDMAPSSGHTAHSPYSAPLTERAIINYSLNLTKHN